MNHYINSAHNHLFPYLYIDHSSADLFSNSDVLSIQDLFGLLLVLEDLVQSQVRSKDAVMSYRLTQLQQSWLVLFD